ncbi:MAG: XRE family transcriptional regulator [Clostridia bacterium]|nr:XRE family transcriptional regulator [Clostridia bacterium]
MENARKAVNIQIGRRLREARMNLGYKQADFAVALQLTEEHYRKLELGATGISADKFLILYQKYGIDSTYLIAGEKDQEFDVDNYVANCSKEQRDRFLERVGAYIVRLAKMQ